MKFCKYFCTISHNLHLVIFLNIMKFIQECEEKEEKLVTDAVKHLTEANVQINSLSRKFTTKTNESHKQKEEITQLLAQVGTKSLFFDVYLLFT